MREQFYILFFLVTISLFAQNDTLNQIDINGLKQNYWILYFDNTDKILEEGKYIDDKREGLWKQYLEDGTISSEISYVEDEPNGYAKIYYPNGKIAEEGIWRNDVWVGEYIAYYLNGNVNYRWNFSEEGKREGKQEYFHENGKKMISGTWEDGAESGVVKWYDRSGVLIEEQTFNKGVVNPELTVKHIIKKQEIEDKPINIEPDTLPKEEIEMFNATGERKLFNKNRLLWKDGYFEDGKLIKGKVYFYNSDNGLIRTDIYKNGKIYNTIKSKE